MDLTLLVPQEICIRIMAICAQAPPTTIQFFSAATIRKFACVNRFWSLQMRILKLDADPAEPKRTENILETPSASKVSRKRLSERNLDWLQLLRRQVEMKDLNAVLQDENIHISAEIDAIREEKIAPPALHSSSHDAAEAEGIHILAAQIKDMQQQFKIALEKFKIQSQTLAEERAASRLLQDQLQQLKAAAGELAALKEQLPKTLEAVKMQRERIIQQQTQLSVLGLDLDAERRVTQALINMLPEASRAAAVQTVESIRKQTTQPKAQVVQQQIQQTTATRSRGISMLFAPPPMQ